MKIRAITLGYDIFSDTDFRTNVRRLLTDLQQLKHKLTEKYEVEYVRLATPPFQDPLDDKQTAQFLDPHYPDFLEEMVKANLLNIYSYSPGLLDKPSSLSQNDLNLLENLPNLINSHPNMFTSLQVGSTQNGINFHALEEAVKVIFKLAGPDPFQNVKYAITFNVPSNTPFFPSAYHLGKTPKLSIALEAADEIFTLFQEFNSQTASLQEIKSIIQTRFLEIYQELFTIIEPFCEKSGIEFVGIDFSPAPYPSKEKSIGNALESLGITEFGGHGSVFSVGFITQAIQSINCPKIGFSGFMQPLLEDTTIAQRNNEGKVDLSKLLLYSTMCGLGLDCVPIPGDSSLDAVNRLLMDLGMISMRLNKPLTARLMPIPNKGAKEETSFDFEYFTNSQICRMDDYSKQQWNEFRKFNSVFKF